MLCVRSCDGEFLARVLTSRLEKTSLRRCDGVACGEERGVGR